jgi:hypothetical protein
VFPASLRWCPANAGRQRRVHQKDSRTSECPLHPAAATNVLRATSVRQPGPCSRRAATPLRRLLAQLPSRDFHGSSDFADEHRIWLTGRKARVAISRGHFINCRFGRRFLDPATSTDGPEAILEPSSAPLSVASTPPPQRAPRAPHPVLASRQAVSTGRDARAEHGLRRPEGPPLRKVR